MPPSDRDLRAQLMQLTLGYWRAQVLFAALRLGVFDALEGGPLPAAALAERCGAARGHLERLLHAAVALGLIEREGGEAFRNGRLAEAFLVRNSPQSLGHWVRFMADCYRPWASLTETVRTGEPAADGLAALFAGQDYTRDLILAMHEYAMGPGRDMAARVDLAGRRRLLDVGGGAGSYSILLCQRFPELSAVVFDLPSVAPIAREVIASSGLAGRISVVEGDYQSGDLGSGFDVALLSNMLHQEDPETCVRLLRRAHGALVEDGLLIIQLAFLNADKDGPLWSVLQSLQLALLYQGGRAYAFDEVLAMLPQAGFANAVVKKTGLLSSESLVLATRAPAPAAVGPAA